MFRAFSFHKGKSDLKFSPKGFIPCRKTEVRKNVFCLIRRAVCGFSFFSLMRRLFLLRKGNHNLKVTINLWQRRLLRNVN